MKKDSRVKAVISLDAVEHNFREMRKNIAEETKMIAVIKADAYGHGAVPVAHLIEDYDYIWGFAAATAEEAIHLREAGITKPILILGIVFDEYFPELVRYEIRPAVCEYEEASKLSDEAVLQKKTVHIHIALDTGMTRIGFADAQENVEEIKKISELPNLEIEGMFTHFARADEYDRSPAMVQLERYLDFSRRVEEAGVEIPLHHCSNSAGIIRMPEANLNIVRAGITIYGIYPSSEVERDIVKLEPVMELKSHVTYVKDVPAGAAISYGGTFKTEHTTRIGVVPYGYADGFFRCLSNRCALMTKEGPAPQRGKICMDMCMIDLTGKMGVDVGSEVEVFGKQNSINDLAALAGTIPYELTCAVSKRVPRIYIRNGKVVEKELLLRG